MTTPRKPTAIIDSRIETRDAEPARADHAGDQREGQEAGEGAGHVEVAMGEVQQLHDAEDHGVAERHQRVERAEDEPVHQLLGEKSGQRHARLASKSGGEARGLSASDQSAVLLGQRPGAALALDHDEVRAGERVVAA